MEAEPLEAPSGRLATWKSYLAGSLGKANQCRTFSKLVCGQSSIVILGRTTDARTVRYLYSMLCGEVERLTKWAVPRVEASRRPPLRWPVEAPESSM